MPLCPCVTRIRQKEVRKNDYPIMLMHSTQIALLDSICLRGIKLGGLTRRRVDVFMRSATEFAFDLNHPQKMYAQKLNWKDPVANDHMRMDSDVVIFISGKLLEQLRDFKLYVSGDTGDYVTPNTIPTNCLISARRRTDGHVELEAPLVLERSRLYEHPSEFFAATGEECGDRPVPPAWRRKPKIERRALSKSPPPQRARGSTDPPPQEQSSRGSGAAPPKVRLTDGPGHKKELVSPPQSPRGSPFPHNQSLAGMLGTSGRSSGAVVEPPQKTNPPPKDDEKSEDKEEEFRPDWDEDFDPAHARAEEEDGVFSVKEEKVIGGKLRLTERKARFCVHCKAECVSTLKTCHNCAGRPDGAPDKETADLVGRLFRTIRPTVEKWVGRGGRSVKGNMRDDYRRRFRRAKELGFKSVLDRFQHDDKDNYKFRINMLANGWTEETIATIDEVATSEGIPVPKAGEGRNRLQREQSEGWYDRVDGHGAEADRPIDERNVPPYVHERNAQRRAETALATNQLPTPGKGSWGYQAAKGKGKGQKRQRDQAGSWETGDRAGGTTTAPAWAANATWWTATASTWWQANSKATEENTDDASWLFPVLCIFLVGVLFGGIMGYLVAYSKYNKPKPPAPGERIEVLADADWVRDGAPRNRMPQIRVPDQVLITRTGGSFHRASGCSVTTRGEERHTNRRLDKCALCYPVHREE